MKKWWTVLSILLVILWWKVSGAGFELRGPLTFSGYYSSYESWAVGNGVRIIGIDESIAKRLYELEGKRVRIVIEEIK